MTFHPRSTGVAVSIVATTLLAVVVAYLLLHSGDESLSGLGGAGTNAKAQGAATRPSTGPGSGAPPTVNLTDSQLGFVKVEPATEREFAVEKESVGSIDFNQDMTVQVFTPYQGRIVGLFAKVGDAVQRGQTLFTIDSPDLLQAESTLTDPSGR